MIVIISHIFVALKIKQFAMPYQLRSKNLELSSWTITNSSGYLNFNKNLWGFSFSYAAQTLRDTI